MSQEASNQQAAPPRVKLRIRSAQDLHDLLTGSDPAVRLHVLKAIAANPQAAMRYGQYQGRDLVDLVIALMGKATGQLDRLALLGALTALPGERAFDALCRVFARARDLSEVRLVTGGLARGEPGAVRDFLLPYLMQDELPFHARAAAQVLAKRPDLTPEQRMQAALVGPGGPDCAPPPLDGGHLDLWLQALAGPHGAYARQLTLAQERPGYDALAEAGDELGQDLTLWLERWGQRQGWTS